MSVAMLVEDAMTMLSLEHRPAYEQMRKALGARVVDICVDDEMVRVAFETDVTSSIEIRTDLNTVCELLEGQTQLHDALLADRLHVIGAVDDLLSLGATLTVFLEGVLRCVSSATLVTRLYSLREGLKA